MTKDELSTEDIKILEILENAAKVFVPSDLRNVLKHVSEIVRADKKADDEPKFKVGDKVVVTSDNDFFVPYVGKIVCLDEDSACITIGRGCIKVPIDRLTPYTEPTAGKGEEKLQSRLDNADSASSILNILREETVPTPAWQSYRMELAAKIAVAYAEKGRYEPEEIGAKAVEVANGVVERLKNGKQ